MDRGESLTPPVSPVGLSIEDLIESEQIEVEEENIERETICFTCGEDSYFNGGYMRGLLKSNHHDNIFNQKEISLFSHTWPNMNCENFDRLFLMMRQQIGDLQSTAVISRLSFMNDSDGLQGNTVRQQVCSFLQYVLDYVQSQHVSKNDIQSIVNGLQTVLLHIGRLSELPNHILHTTSIGSKLTISEHCLHLHLDVYWRILSIIHTIEVKYSDCGINVGGYFNNDDQYDNTSLFNNILHSILWDLTCLANVRYISKVNRDDPMETTMFGCSCIKEIWTLILVVTDWRSNTHIGESFWISFHHILKSCLDLDITDTSMLMEVDDCRSVKNPPDIFKTDDAVGLNLWMLYHLSSLYTQTLLSTVVNNWSSKPVSNYHDLEAVIKKLFATPNVSESTLKKHLWTCLYLTNDWEPNTRLLITLWDFYYKRLNQNDSYQSSRSTLDGLACMDTSVVSMYDRCLQWTQAHLDSLKKDTSYQIFIRILCQHLGKLYRNGSTQEWKQVKGRIYSKFHARRLQELMECGLYNLTVLFVSLGMTADLEDVSSKLCDFYDMLDINAITYAKRCVIWRGAFTLMLVYVSQDMDISFLADKMSSTFEHVVNDYETAGIDNKHNLWKLILIYLEGLEEVVESSKNILQSQYKLLGPALHKLLTICSEQELRTTLSTLHAVITKYREIITKTPRNSLDVKSSLQYAECSCVLWRNVYSFVVDHSQTLTPPPILADMAATFCLLALNNFEDEGNDKKKSFMEIFKYFSVSEKVNTSISCNFLSLLLPCDEVLTRLQTELSNYEQFIINIWFRCCLILPHGSTVLQNITRCVKKLPQFNDIMMQSELVWDDIDEVPVLFLKGLEKIHKKIENWQEKMKFQQQIIPYFTDVLKYINPVIKSWNPVDVVNKIYLMTGYLIKYCAKLIYVRQDVIVPGLINGLILPYNILNPDKPVNNIFISAVRRHLHLFLEGLSKLSYDKDPFLSRKLQDIMVTYLPKFQLSGSSLMMSSVAKSVHPLVTSLSGSCQSTPPLEAVKFRHHVIKLAINSFIVVRNMAVHKHHSLGFTYIKELVQRTNSEDVKLKDLTLLFGVCLEYLLLLPNTSNIWTMVVNILQDLSHSYHHDHGIQDETLSSLTSTCKSFVSTYFKFSSTGVLKVLEKISVILKHVVIGTIEQVTGAVKELESKRGVGVDSSLRKQYFQVLKLLGERGTAEITELSSNAL